MVYRTCRRRPHTAFGRIMENDLRGRENDLVVKPMTNAGGAPQSDTSAGVQGGAGNGQGSGSDAGMTQVG